MSILKNSSIWASPLTSENGKPIQEFPKGWQDSLVCVGSDVWRKGLETKYYTLHIDPGQVDKMNE